MSASKGVEKIKCSSIVVGKGKWFNIYGKQYGDLPQKVKNWTTIWPSNSTPGIYGRPWQKKKKTLRLLPYIWGYQAWGLG